MSKVNCSQEMWVQPDVLGLFLDNVGSGPNGINLTSDLLLDQLLTQFLPGFDHQRETLGPPPPLPGGAHLGGVDIDLGAHKCACRSRHAVEGCTTPGLRLFRQTWQTCYVVDLRAIRLWDLWCHRNLCGHGPHKTGKFPGHGHDHLVGVCAAGHQASKAFTEPHLRLPTDVLDRFRQLFEPELQVAADFGGIPGRPRRLRRGHAPHGYCRLW
jgi:hypothetical protein